MPSVSEVQRRAMEAAAHGHSTLGIPKAVGEEFVAADAMNGIAAGIMFVAPDGEILLLRRRTNDENWAGHWDLPGGKGEMGEAAEEIAAREAKEETGMASERPRKLLDSAVTPRGMGFHTFVQPTDTKFTPELSDEHVGFTWTPLDQLPQPIHPGVFKTLSTRLGLDLLAAMTPVEITEMKTNFADWARAEFAPAQDRAIAFDRETVRTIDVDGHLKVEMTPISKANVCPYYGREIPDHEKLGLDADKIYQLYRDAGELAKAAPSFAGKQLLLEHVSVSADDPHLERTIGSVGDDVIFSAPYLMAPLSIWDAEAISLIESGERKELSSAYRYRADMTSGVSPDGERYDGIMRDILGNHVAMVAKGRAGADVLVQDALPDGLAPDQGRAGPVGDKQEILMSKTKLSLMSATAHGALLTYLKPRLAQDAKVDLTEALTGLTSKNFKDKRTSIVTSLKTATSGKLAKDANIDDIVDVLEAIESIAPAEDMEPNAAVPMGKAEDEEPAPRKRINEFLKDKLSADDMKACDALWDDDEGQEAMDAEEDEEAKKKAKDKKGMDRKAMDQAFDERVSKAVADVRQAERNIRTAEEDVRPYIGKIAVAMDSAEDVYKTALVALGVDLTDVPATAFKAILKSQPVPGSGARPPKIAADAAAMSGFYGRFPEAKDHPVKTL